MKDYSKLKYEQLVKLPIYKNIPRSIRKTYTDRESLITLLQTYERAYEKALKEDNLNKDVSKMLADVDLIKNWQCEYKFWQSDAVYDELQRIDGHAAFLGSEFLQDGCLSGDIWLQVRYEDVKDEQYKATNGSYPQRFKVSENFTREYNSECRRGGIRLYMIGISYDKGFSHALILLRDDKRKELELFDPNANILDEKSKSEEKSILNKVVKILKIDASKFTLLQTVDYCPFAPQNKDLSREGLCQHFSLFYAWLRLRHPEVSRNIISKYYSDMPSKDLYNLMANFQCYIMSSLISSGAHELLNELKYYSDSFHFEYDNVKAKFEIRELLTLLVNTGDVALAKEIFEDILWVHRLGKVPPKDPKERQDLYRQVHLDNVRLKELVDQEISDNETVE
jgi:hypothetical protein